MKKLPLILCLLLSTQLLLAQTAKEILKQKTERQLQNIVETSSYLTGLMAIDLTTGESFSINQDVVFAQASAIKIPILMEVYKQAHEKKFALTDVRPLLSANTVAGSGILNVMADPVSLSIRNYCMLMIGLSDNSATNTLIDLVGMQNINKTMQDLGLKNTRVQRKMIDQPASLRNEENISTPAEAVKIMKLLHDGKFISKDISDEILITLQKNPVENSKIAKGIPSSVKIAFKPGGMGGVSTEWAVVYLAKRPYAIAVMENYKAGTASQDVMANISKTLYEYYFRMAKATDYGVILD
ncbi:serine hydrolase [Daejeonella sp.]|uniref:serine hydrolase n=1 Tax=Daejeonella sp. TaxID=2805397 RepID=UPI0039834801